MQVNQDYQFFLQSPLEHHTLTFFSHVSKKAEEIFKGKLVEDTPVHIIRLTRLYNLPKFSLTS